MRPVATLELLRALFSGAGEPAIAGKRTIRGFAGVRLRDIARPTGERVAPLAPVTAPLTCPWADTTVAGTQCDERFGLR